MAEKPVPDWPDVMSQSGRKTWPCWPDPLAICMPSPLFSGMDGLTSFRVDSVPNTGLPKGISSLPAAFSAMACRYENDFAAHALILQVSKR